MIATPAVLVLTAIWHFLAAYFFMFKAGGMLAVHTFERPVSPVAQDMMRFLGGINLGYAVLAALAVFQPLSALPLVCLTLAIANASQFWFDLVGHRSGRWKRRLAFITVFDGLFALANLVCALAEFLEAG